MTSRTSTCCPAYLLFAFVLVLLGPLAVCGGGIPQFRLVADEDLFRGRGELVDIDGDGLADFVYAARPFRPELRVRFGARDGLGPFEAVDADTPTPVASFRGILETGGPLRLGFSDGGDRLRLFEVGERGLTGTPVDVPLSASPRSLELVDWNGVPGHLLGSWEGGFRTFIELSSVDLAAPLLNQVARFDVPFRSGNARAIDLDGDQLSEIVFSSPGGVSIARGGPDGPRVYGGLIPDVDVEGLAAADVDGDGVWELFVGGEDAIVEFRRDPEGEWTPTVLLEASRPRSIQAADLDGDSQTDLVASTFSGFEIFRNVDGELEVPPVFLPGRESRLLIDDLDGDGHLDLVGYGPGGMAVSYGLGDGAYPTPLAIGEFTVVASADLNSDGRPDLVADVPDDPSMLQIFLAQAEGGFGEPTRYRGLEGGVSSVAAGDLNGDGDADIVATAVVQGAFFAAGRGDGSIEGFVALPLVLAGDLVVAAGDVDGNGADDVVVGGELTPAHLILAPDPGESEFPDPVILDATNSQIAALDIVDLDGDGELDVLVGLAGGTSRVLEGNGSGGFPVEAMALELIVNSLGASVGDVNGDEFPDGFGTVLGERVVFVGRGQFQFDAVALPPHSRFFVPSGLVDIDDDGLVDLVGAEFSNLVIFRGLGEESFEAPRSYYGGPPGAFFDIDGDGRAEIQGQLAATQTSWVSYGGSRSEPVLATRAFDLSGSEASIGDIGGDGRVELVMFRSENSRLGSLFVYAANGLREPVELREIVLDDLGRDGQVSRASSLIHDVDGDGAQDLLYHVFDTVYWQRSLGDLELAERAVLLGDVPGSGISVHDLDDDGEQDLLVDGFHVARSLGGSRFSPPRSYFLVGFADQNVVGDFNGDRLLDVAYPFRSSRGEQLVLAHGLGSAGEEGENQQLRFQSLESLPNVGGPDEGSLELGDFNGDGLIDIVHADYGNRLGLRPTVWYGTGGGDFSARSELDDPEGDGDGFHGLAVEDVDQDGYDDLFAGDEDGFVLFYRGGESGLEEPLVIPSGVQFPRIFQTGDVDGDGVPDLVVGGERGLFELRRIVTTPGGQIPGDCSQDGGLDVSDAVCILGVLFLGIPPRFPCDEDGGVGDGTRALLDWEQNGVVEISDAVQLLQFAFLGGPAHALAVPGAETSSCIQIEGCPEGPGCLE